MNMITPNPPRARNSGLVIQELENEVLIYDLDNDSAHCLNDTAAAVWRACDGHRQIKEITSFVKTQLKNDITEDVVLLALKRLEEHNLLEQKFDYVPGGVSRREAVRRIGIASMVALPVIASLSVPKSVFAANSCACQGQLSCVTQTGCPTYCNQRTGLCEASPP